MNDRDLIIAYLRSTADFWKKESGRLGRNPLAAAAAEAKAGALDAVATDIENGLHLSGASRSQRS
jgi:hypothetical protein